MTEPFTLRVSRQGPVATVDLHGEVDLTCMDTITKQLLSYLDTDTVQWVYVDVHDVTFIDSCGITALIRGKNRAVEIGKVLPVVGSHGRVDDVLQLAGVSDYLTHRDLWVEADPAGSPGPASAP